MNSIQDVANHGGSPAETALLLVAAASAIGSLVGVAKIAGLPRRFAPLLAVLLGIAAGWLGVGHFGLEAVVKGVTCGMTAIGGYEFQKSARGTDPDRAALFAASKRWAQPFANEDPETIQAEADKAIAEVRAEAKNNAPGN